MPAVAVLLNAVTLTVTVSTVKLLSSVRKMPAVPVPVLSAVTVATFVVRWFSAEPIASSAARRRFVAVTFFVLPAAFTMAPVSATTLTLVAITWPSVTLPEAFRRTLLFVAVMLAAP